jgi:beta-glucanase (GH16 family)
MCLIYEDNFETLNTDIWTHEVQIDGFGNHAFDWTTTDERNSYVDAEGLHIVPTLTTEDTDITADQMWANYTLNINKGSGGDGSCTSDANSSCFIRSDPVKGSMIPPVRSARLSTKGKKSIRYGQVEVVAKLPEGDWLWPAIWMMPENSVYGDWPRSGEIDIMESRGNSAKYPEGGRNVYYGKMPKSRTQNDVQDTKLTKRSTGTTHWGPTVQSDAYWRSTGAKKIRRGEYSDSYHTYGMQWTEDYIYFYVDSRVKQILFLGYKEKKPLYEFGDFAAQAENSTLLDNPWANSTSTTGNAPFDQDFYLILNVAVGGTNGWFLDQIADKPWVRAFELIMKFSFTNDGNRSMMLQTHGGLSGPQLRSGFPLGEKETRRV